MFFFQLGLVCFVCFWTYLYFYFTRNFDHWKKKNVFFLKPLPFVGNVMNTLLMRQSIGESFQEMYNKTTKQFIGFFVLDQPCLLVRDPNIIKTILVQDFQYFFDRTGTDNKRDDPIGSHILFMLKNPDWRQIRTKISPVFSSSKMKMMSQLVKESAQDLVEYLSACVKNNPIIETKAVFSKFTVDAISSTAFGVSANSFKDENSEFKRIASKVVDWTNLYISIPMRCYFLTPTLVKIFRMKFLNGKCCHFLKTTFNEIMDDRKASGNKRSDLIDLLIHMQANDESFDLAGDILTAQAVNFFVAGFETSSTAMTYALYELTLHPEIQEKLREEIKESSEKYGGINYDSIKDMTYLDMCVKETIRKYPVLPFLDRRCNTDYKIPGTDVIIDKHTPVFIPVMALHYDEEYFPEPEKFNPEKFSNKWQSSRFAYMTVKFGIVSILTNFETELCEKLQTNMKFDPRGLSLAPLDGLHLRFRKLNTCSN